ncbi:MAG TPA: glycosyltransferase family 4 protein [Anaerolineae bacterium]
MIRVIYTQAAKFGGAGIGTIAYYFVHAIAQAGYLQRAIVAYADSYDLPRRQIRTFPWMRLVARLARDNHPLRDTVFDWAAARFIEPCDVFHGWSDQCLYSLRQAKKLGALTFVERPNSHERQAFRLIQEEYDRWGFKDRAAIRPLGLQRPLAEYAMADFVTVPSSFVYDSFLAEGFTADRLFLVPYGVDIDHFIPATKPPASDHFVLLFVGQVSLRKGIPYLLKAWQQLNLPQAKLWLAGRVAPNAEAFVAGYAGDATIRFLGHVHDPRPLYQQASAFVLPSIEEGSALVTYEAMASALPLIYTHNTGAIARDGIEGIQIPIRDVDALAAAIERLYWQPELRWELGQNARRRAKAYTWQKAGEKLLAAYHAALERRQSSG